MAVTRIKNNQITDSTITYTKIASGTLVGSNFNANLTLNSNVTIVGNLSVSGTTATVSSTNTYINDPIVVFNNGYTGSLSGYDIGMLVNRNLSALPGYGSVNTAWTWDEATGAFQATATTDTGTGITTLNNSGFANVRVGNLTAYSLSVAGGEIFGTISTANVALYENVTATTTNATFYPQFTDRATTGNSSAFVGAGLTFNPSTNNLSTTTFTGTFSGTASITSGSVTGITGAASTLVATNFSSGNAQITGGSITGGTGAFTTLTATNFSTANAVSITGASIGTAAVTNFSSGNAFVSGGAIGMTTGGVVSRVANVYSTTENATNFSTGNALITGGSITGGTGAFTTLQATNFSAANAVSITGASIGTAVVTNFSSGNIVVTGGSINGTTVGATTAASGRFTTITGTDTTNATSTTTGAVQIAGGIGVAKDVWIGGNLYVANIFSTSYSVLAVNDPLLYLTANVTYPYNYDIGLFSQFVGGTANVYQHSGAVRDATDDTWKFFSGVAAEPTTTIDFTSAIYDKVRAGELTLSNTTAATSTSTGALVVSGGTGIGGALYVGGQIFAAGVINGTATTANVGIYATQTATSTNATFYPTFTDRSTTGNSSNFFGTGLTFNPSTNNLATTTFTGTFSGTASITSGSVTGITGAASTLVATNFSTGNAQITGGSVTGITGSASTFTTTNLSTGNAQITGGAISNATGAFTTLSASNNFYVSQTTNSTSANTGAAVILGGVGIGGSLYTQGIIVSTGNVVASNTAESSSTVTGALVSRGGLGVASNVFVGKAATFNSTQTSGADFKVAGVGSTNLLWAKPGTYDQVLIGNSATAGTFVTGAKLQINSTDSILLPVGTNAQRPGSSGGTDTVGMFRYNTTQNGIEYYGGSTPGWQSVTTQFTVISDEQFNGDGITTVFTLSDSQTTNSCIVSINGVIQIPTLAYAVTGGTTLTFTEAPASGDVIDVRKLTTTATVTQIASQNGYMQFITDNNGAYVYTGSSSTAATTYWDTSGAKVGAIANVSVASANTPTTIDTMATGTYRSAKYVVQVTNGANYQVMEALMISNGTTATVTVYGTVQTGGNLGVLSATQSGGSALLQFSAANATNNVRITKDYLLI